MQPELRPASPQDEQFLWRLYASTRADEIAAWGWTLEQKESFLRMQYHARCQSYLVSYPAAEQSIVLAGGLPIGAMIVARTPSELRLVDIALLPEYRGRGLGAYLIRELMREANDGSLPLRLSVLRTNRALLLYDRLGLVAIGGDAMYSEMEYKPGRS